MCFLYLLSAGCLSTFFTQNLYSFWIGPFLLHSAFGVWLYAFQQRLFYQHFLQHSFHITTAEIWLRLKEYRMMYGKAVIAYLFVRCILLWTLPALLCVVSSSAISCLTVNSFKKETMQIVYCQHHITIKFPFIGTWNCSLVNAEFTHKLSLKTSICVFCTSDEIQTQFCACQKKQN